MFWCSICNRKFDSRKGLRYLYACSPDEEDAAVVRYWDWIVCEDPCAGRVRNESTNVVIDEPWR